MAKLSMINSESKRAKMVAKYAAKSTELATIYNDVNLSSEKSIAARLKFHQ